VGSLNITDCHYFYSHIRFPCYPCDKGCIIICCNEKSITRLCLKCTKRSSEIVNNQYRLETNMYRLMNQL
jgi:hypothetical protein